MEVIAMAANEKSNPSRTGNDIIDDFVKLRKSRHMSQTAIAKKAGLHQAAVGRIENKSTEPRLETLLKMLNTMGYTLAIIPSYDAPEYAINLEISEVLDNLKKENLERVKAYADALHEEDVKKSMDVFNEFSKLCRPMDIDENYRAILEEELIRKHGNLY